RILRGGTQERQCSAGPCRGPTRLVGEVTQDKGTGASGQPRRSLHSEFPRKTENRYIQVTMKWFLAIVCAFCLSQVSSRELATVREDNIVGAIDPALER